MLRAITVCTNYSDYLSIALPYNRRFFDSYTIITVPEDGATIQLAKMYDCVVELIETDKKDYVRKGMMNEGLKRLVKPAWIQILDADIVLPESYGAIARNVEALERDALHGCNRLFAHNRLIWDLAKFEHLDVYEAEVNPRAVGIGFFQLFNSNSRYLAGGHDWYGMASDQKAADMSFRTKFPAHQIKGLPFSVIHLGPPSTNWYGRRSAKFA